MSWASTSSYVLLAGFVPSVGAFPDFGPLPPSEETVVPNPAPKEKRRKGPMITWVEGDEETERARLPLQTEKIAAKQVLPGTFTLELDGLQYDDMTSCRLNIDQNWTRIVSAFSNLNCQSQGNSQNLDPTGDYLDLDGQIILLAAYEVRPGQPDLVGRFGLDDPNGNVSEGPGPLVRLRSVHGDMRCREPDRVTPLFMNGFEL